MDPVIETADLSCRYGRHEALHDVTFAVQPGSIFGLLGPNGAGKTTTVRVLMNILRPTRGIARVLGTDTRRLGPSQLQMIGYVSENQELPLWMTVEQLLAFCGGLRFAGLPIGPGFILGRNAVRVELRELDFPPRWEQEKTPLRLDPEWLAGAELLIVKTSYAGRVRRELSADGFTVP
jgi:ABC-type sugar transport system ATPase subunit